MKVINWLFGSFFRTIGRTIAILLMGGLLYYILASNGVGVKDLFFESVKAESYTSGSWHDYWKNASTKLSYESGTGYYTTNVQSFPIYLFFNQNISQAGPGLILPSNATKVRFHLRISSFDVNPSLQHIYNSFTIAVYYDKGNLTYCNTVQANNYNENQLTYTNQLDLTMECPIIKTSSYLTVIFIRGNDSSAGYPFKIDINPSYTFEYDDASEGIQGVIQEQQDTNDKLDDLQQQQEQQHQEMMDDNTTAAEDEGSSFFGNFTTEDHGGLNAIITAPLNTIRSLLNSSCTKLTLPLPYVNKNLELPCMNDIYTQHFGLFFSLYQTIILAIISYRCLRSIFFDITGFTNPDDDRIEVMDL